MISARYNQLVRASLPGLFGNQIIQAMLFALALVALYLLRDLITALFAAFIVLSGFRPGIELLERAGMPRFLAIALPYIAVIAIVAAVLAGLVPVILTEAPQAIGAVQRLLAAMPVLGGAGLANALSSAFTAVPSSLVSTTLSFAAASVYAVAALVISLYALLDHERVYDTVGRSHPHAREFLERLEHDLGAWLRGQVLLAVAVGILATLALLEIGVPYAAFLGLIAGIFELVPFAGPIFSGALAVLIAANVDPVKALLTAIAFIIIQQIESHVLTPQIMRYAVALHPVVAITAILAGGTLYGIPGAIFAIPVAITIRQAFQELKILA